MTDRQKIELELAQAREALDRLYNQAAENARLQNYGPLKTWEE